MLLLFLFQTIYLVIVSNIFPRFTLYRYSLTFDEASLSEVLGPSDALLSLKWMQLVSWLVGHLTVAYSLGECHMTDQSDATDASGIQTVFLLELSGFLREYGCPYGSLFARLQSQQPPTAGGERLELLYWLVTDCLAARITASTRPQLLAVASAAAGAGDSDPAAPSARATTRQHKHESESAVAREMRLMCMSLGLPRPPDNMDTKAIFSRITTKVCYRNFSNDHSDV